MNDSGIVWTQADDVRHGNVIEIIEGVPLTVQRIDTRGPGGRRVFMFAEAPGFYECAPDRRVRVRVSPEVETA